jgi:putative hemolysin
MENSNLLGFLLLLFLMLDLLFAILRVSFVYVRLPHLIGLREQFPDAVMRTLKLLEKPYLPATLRLLVVGVHFLLLALFWMTLAQPAGLTGNLWLTLFFSVLAALVLLLVEFAIEGVVLRDVERWALRMTPLAETVVWLLQPLSWLLTRIWGSPEVLQRSLGTVTEDALKTWVEEGQKEGSLEKEEREMIYSIFHFSDRLCREIMVPRIDVFALEVNTSLPEAVQAVLLSGHSRLPVYEDTIDNVVGLLYAKDMLRLQVEHQPPASVRELLRPVYFVPEAKKVDQLLREMQERGVHMVVVIDEYGGMAGIVTLEDIVEEIVGEIRDEYDAAEEQPYQQVGPEEYLFQARIDLDDLNELLGTHLTKEIADTLGGFIYSEIGRVPSGGEQIRAEDWLLTVEQVTGRRIRLVRAKRVPLVETEEQEVIHGADE